MMMKRIMGNRAKPVLAAPAYREIDFPSLRLARSSRRARRIARWLIVALVVSVLAMVLLPWQQSIRGDGAGVAFDPVNRPQAVQAPVKGVIAEIGEGIFENAKVTKGQLVYRIADQDPQYLTRLRQQVLNTQDQMRAAQQRLDRAVDQLEASRRVVEAKKDEVASLIAAQKEAEEARAAEALLTSARG